MEPKEIGALIQRRREEMRLSQDAVADAIEAGQSTIDRIEKGNFKRMPSVMPRLAALLKIPLSELDPGPVAVQVPASSLIPENRLLGRERNFPVYASVEGGPGEIIRDPSPVDWVPRPSIVQHVSEAYGLIATGESMQPEIEPGDTLIINPRMPALPGTTCVFYHEVDGEARATVKRLLRATGDNWSLRQWNPDKEFLLKRNEWRVVHRVLGKYYRQ